jgi:hypothetical protein
MVNIATTAQQVQPQSARRVMPLSPTAVARQASRTGRGPSDQPDFFRELVGTKPGVENANPLPRSYGAQSRLVPIAPAAPGSRQDWQRTFFGMPDNVSSGAGRRTGPQPGEPQLTMQRTRGRGGVSQPWSHQSYGSGAGPGKNGWWPRTKEDFS